MTWAQINDTVKITCGQWRGATGRVVQAQGSGGCWVEIEGRGRFYFYGNELTRT